MLFSANSWAFLLADRFVRWVIKCARARNGGNVRIASYAVYRAAIKSADAGFENWRFCILQIFLLQFFFRSEKSHLPSGTSAALEMGLTNFTLRLTNFLGILLFEIVVEYLFF